MAKVVKHRIAYNFVNSEFASVKKDGSRPRKVLVRFCGSKMSKLFDVDKHTQYNVCMSTKEPSHGEAYKVMKYYNGGNLKFLDAYALSSVCLFACADRLYERMMKRLGVWYEDEVYVWVEEA
jgi:hypothetical protein